MTKQQFRISTDTLSPLYRATVGFDRLFEEFDRLNTTVSSQGYPPYNISKSKQDLKSLK